MFDKTCLNRLARASNIKMFDHYGAPFVKKNYLEQICDIFSYLEIIKTARKFIYK